MKPLLLLKKALLLRKAKKSPYFEEFYEETDLNKKVEETTFVVFDCEATDLNPKKAFLLSLGALKVEELKLDLSHSFYRFLKLRWEARKFTASPARR